MSQDFEKSAKMALDSVQRYKKAEEQAREELTTLKSHNMTTPGFDEGERVIRAQNQAPLDIAAELKAIHNQLDIDQHERTKSEKEGKKRDRRTFLVAVLTLIATVAIGAITILLQLRQQ